MSKNCQNVQNSDFQSQFSMSKMIQIFLTFFFIAEYDLRSTLFVTDIQKEGVVKCATLCLKSWVILNVRYSKYKEIIGNSRAFCAKNQKECPGHNWCVRADKKLRPFWKTFGRPFSWSLRSKEVVLSKLGLGSEFVLFNIPTLWPQINSSLKNDLTKYFQKGLPGHSWGNAVF